MPHKCCVATCKGNYKNGPKVAVFSFPTEEQLRKQWIWNCKRKDGFKPTKHSKVCELHFKQEDVLRQTEFFDEKTGKKIIIPLSYPRLKNGCNSKSVFLMVRVILVPVFHQGNHQSIKDSKENKMHSKKP
ncbi:THAP domain-containing protein 1-like [Stegodyphus dumicola]|uniref:THAP domain-containing protein 1-like n=1 Tax=Stegodyphus dumicola TaxID=202533 RepID=UPI0015AA9737|nr:THAP domain-containing protein 1-like [Stegodyphus dumicola]